MKAAYGEKYQKIKKINTAASDMMTIYLGISVLTLRELWGFGYERNAKYATHLSDMVGDWFENYRNHGYKGDIETVGDVYYASKRDVRDIGVNVDEIEKKYAPSVPDVPKYKYERGTPKYRLEFLKASDESMATFWFLTMLWLHEEYEFGAVKLTRYYLQCRQKLMEFYNEYMKCSKDGDEQCVRFRDKIISDCDLIGVDIA